MRKSPHGPTFVKDDSKSVLRNDTKPNTCMYHHFTLHAHSKEDAFFSFATCCVARQNVFESGNLMQKNFKAFECEDCLCGKEIKAGRRTILPDNIKWELIK